MNESKVLGIVRIVCTAVMLICALVVDKFATNDFTIIDNTTNVIFLKTSANIPYMLAAICGFVSMFSTNKRLPFGLAILDFFIKLVIVYMFLFTGNSMFLFISPAFKILQVVTILVILSSPFLCATNRANRKG